MSSAASREVALPRGALWAIGGMVGLALLGAIAGRIAGPAPSPHSTATATRALRFADMPDGSVGVFDSTNNATVAMLPRGTNNFTRALLRGLVHARRAELPDPSQSFVLTSWADGRLTLVDSVDGRTVELEAFGTTNEADFGRLLTAKEVPTK